MASVEGGPFLEVSVPVAGTDASRVEALGPPLAALLLAQLPAGRVTFHGDSRFVVDLVTRKVAPRDPYLYNCTALLRDLLVGGHYTAQWHSRDENTLCDSLARAAVRDGAVTVTVHAHAPVADTGLAETRWRQACDSFRCWFGGSRGTRGGSLPE